MIKTPKSWDDERLIPKVETETIYGNKVMVPKIL